jgi:hypothetical protein
MAAQAIVGTFLTVATSVAEAEAYIATTQDRFWKRAIKLWTFIPYPILTHFIMLHCEYGSSEDFVHLSTR